MGLLIVIGIMIWALCIVIIVAGHASALRNANTRMCVCCTDSTAEHGENLCRICIKGNCWPRYHSGKGRS